MDGGVSWQTQMSGQLGDMNGACAIDKCNAWITQDYGVVFWTSDGGKNWNEHDPAAAGHFYLVSVSANTLNEAWVVGQAQFGKGKILHTTDRGINWTEQFAPVDVAFDRVSFVGRHPR